MTDLFNDYKKKTTKKRKNFAIITASLVFALSINAFLFGTDKGVKLQTSVINSGAQSAKKADLSVVSAGTGTDMLKVRTNTKIENASRIYLSLAFDPELVSVNDVFSEDKSVEIVKNNNVAGVSSLTLLYKTPKNLTESSDVITIVYKKKKQEKAVLNLAETQFRSTDGTIYQLSNTPFEF